MTESKPFLPSEDCLDLILEGMGKFIYGDEEIEISGRDEFNSKITNIINKQFGSVVPKEVYGDVMYASEVGPMALKEYSQYIGERVTTAIAALMYEELAMNDRTKIKLINVNRNFNYKIKKQLDEILILSEDASKKIASEYKTFVLENPTRITGVKFEMKNNALYMNSEELKRIEDAERNQNN